MLGGWGERFGHRALVVWSLCRSYRSTHHAEGTVVAELNSATAPSLTHRIAVHALACDPLQRDERAAGGGGQAACRGVARHGTRG